MTPLACLEALIRKAWIDSAGQAPAGLRSDAREALNAALQTLWKSDRAGSFARANYDFLTSDADELDEWLEFALPDEINPLPDSVGEVWCAGEALTRCTSRGQFRQRTKLYALTEAAGVPAAFYVEPRYSGQANTDPEARAAVLMLAPIPDSTYQVTFRALTEPPNYSAEALLTDTGAIPIPEREIESLLLPLAGHSMLRSNYVTNPAVRNALAADGELVLHQLGLVQLTDGKESK